MSDDAGMGGSVPGVSAAAPAASICARCGAAFGCAMAAGAAVSGPCWCTLLPKALPVPAEAGAGCWCQACLRAHIDGLPRP